MKKLIALLLSFVMIFCLAACSETGPGGVANEDGLTLALVVAGNFGDRSFYDSSNAGATKLEAEGVTVKRIECGNDKHTEQIYNAADAADIVVLVGWEFYDVEAVAPEYPDVKFIWIDNATSAPVANVLNITYSQNEGSFLAGYVAAKMSESGVIGAMGGQDDATINDFIVGYKQGALYANPDVKVEVIYSNSYDDPAIGKECALTLNEKGADVIFQIASKCGDGVFEAAQEGGFYAIGVDSDQKYIAPETIICSMCKQVGDSIYDAVKQYMDKGDDCGLFGTTWVADMATGYVGLAYGEEGAAQQIPDEIKAEVEELAKKIVAGEIVVDTTR
ncbi:MAG: BMP family ABC transporter substrate-binding protein [Ruminococcaceae bacterium]|nr:BMP family ABC transporter substrate-binding protein [Oscillospiraceae bacterium]